LVKYTVISNILHLHPSLSSHFLAKLTNLENKPLPVGLAAKKRKTAISIAFWSARQLTWLRQKI